MSTLLSLNTAAPDFDLEGVLAGRRQRFSLTGFRGRWLILFFYRADFTFVCPTEIRGFDERMKEFAMESMAWYDVVRWWYYDPQGAYDFISTQDRALFVARPNQWPNPTAWTFEKTSWNNPRTFTANEGNFRLKIPSSEISQVPSLNEEPVAYEFKD